MAQLTLLGCHGGRCCGAGAAGDCGTRRRRRRRRRRRATVTVTWSGAGRLLHPGPCPRCPGPPGLSCDRATGRRRRRRRSGIAAPSLAVVLAAVAAAGWLWVDVCRVVGRLMQPSVWAGFCKRSATQARLCGACEVDDGGGPTKRRSYYAHQSILFIRRMNRKQPTDPWSLICVLTTFDFFPKSGGGGGHQPLLVGGAQRKKGNRRHGRGGLRGGRGGPATFAARHDQVCTSRPGR